MAWLGEAVKQVPNSVYLVLFLSHKAGGARSASRWQGCKWGGVWYLQLVVLFQVVQGVGGRDKWFLDRADLEDPGGPVAQQRSLLWQYRGFPQVRGGQGLGGPEGGRCPHRHRLPNTPGSCRSRAGAAGRGATGKNRIPLQVRIVFHRCEGEGRNSRGDSGAWPKLQRIH